MKNLLLTILILMSSSLYGETKYEQNFDLGINAGVYSSQQPNKTPQVQLLTGIELGTTFFKYEPSTIKNLTTQSPTLRFLRLALGLQQNQVSFILSPISVYLRDNIFLSPSFIVGTKSYSAFSFTYELSN